MIYNLVDKILD